MENNKEKIDNEQPIDNEQIVDDETVVPETEETAQTDEEQPKEEAPAEKTPEERIAELEAQIEQLQKDALYRAAEFDNFRKRTVMEKADLIKYGSQKAVEALLPVIDDLERAMQHIDKADDIESVKEGVALIMQKFQGYLKQQQVTVIPANPGDDFDDKIHEAITMFPAPDPSLKGKIVDCPTKGYKLIDKVIRYAKVVVGQ
jgi:molecular chaperone GrpE